jgi:16S rRNA (uracil1498-N3)-methyltransferase
VRVVRVPVEGLAEGELRLDAEASRFAARVHRLGAGDVFVAFDPARGTEADATIVDVARGMVVARVGAPRRGAVAAQRPLVWLQGIAKGDKVDAIVRDATELGATRIVPFVSRFGVVKVSAAARDDKRARWERVAREAARQSGRAYMPVVDAPRAFEDALAAVDDTHTRILLYERAEDPLGPLLTAPPAGARPLAFAAGPEGGFDGDEVERARAAGWRIASLGDTILRAETVAAAVLGAVRILGGA